MLKKYSVKISVALMLLAFMATSVYAAPGGTESVQGPGQNPSVEGEMAEGACPVVYNGNANDKKTITLGASGSTETDDTKTGAH